MTVAPLYHRPTKSILLQVDDPFQIRELIPNSRTLQHETYNLAVQYTLQTAKLLRNLGHDVPSPMQVNYSWPGKYTPWDHQRVMAEFCTMHKRCFNLSEMGTGKSAATLWAADYLMQTKQVRRALIICPLSTMRLVWVHDIFDVLMHRVASIVHGSRDDRVSALRSPADFYILNHDGVSIEDVADLVRRTPEIDLVVVDEGSMFRNSATRKYKALSKMLRADVRLWWLTATPCPNEPTDAWSQIKLVNPSRAPKFFGAFKRQTMQQITAFKWVPKVDAFDTVYAAMQPAVRFRKADCLDLPAVTFENRQVQMTPEQVKAFAAMKNEMQAEAKTTKITAVNAADKISKLRQILCGAIKDPKSGAYITIPHAPRVSVLLEIIEQANAKVLVIVPFKGIIEALKTEIEKHYSVAVLNGDVSRVNRDHIIHQFKTGKDPHVLLCHPKVMSHGLNLTEADTLIFYAPIYSNDEAQQVTERFNRAGQKNKMTVVKMAAHPLEWDIYKLLNNRASSQDSILTLYKTITE